MSLREGSDRFQEHIKPALDTWSEEIARILIEAGIEPEIARQREEDAIIQIQETLVLTRGLEDMSLFDRVFKRLPGMYWRNNNCDRSRLCLFIDLFKTFFYLFDRPT